MSDLNKQFYVADKVQVKQLWIFLIIVLGIFSVGSATEPKLGHFASNGCSMPRSLYSTDYISCCTHHDLAYWMGGSLDDKNRADAALINCIRSKGAFNFTAGIWQMMLANFGTHRFGGRWTPRRANVPLTEKEWGEVFKLAGDFTSQIPIVKSYNKNKTCTESLLKKLNEIAILQKPSEIVCYDLVNNPGHEKEIAKLIYSNECNLGYFVYQADSSEKQNIEKATLSGYGLCADKIKPEKKSIQAKVTYQVAPPLIHRAPPSISAQ